MYTDPGVFSLVVAGVVGLVLAVPAYLLLFKNKVKGWFRRDGTTRKDK